MESSIHKLGGGVIRDTNSGIGSDCYLDEHSHLEGRSRVSYNSNITGSAVRDSSVVASYIVNSVLINSHVAAGLVRHSALQDVIVRGVGGTHHPRKSNVIDSLLSEGIVVEGCVVRNVELAGPYLLHSDWDHVPKHRLLEHEGIRQGLLQCTNDRYHLGCVCRPFAVWDKREPLLRRYFVGQKGWPALLFDSIRMTFEEWRGEAKTS